MTGLKTMGSHVQRSEDGIACDGDNNPKHDLLTYLSTFQDAYLDIQVISKVRQTTEGITQSVKPRQLKTLARSL